MNYLDSSALLKLVFTEDESSAFRSWYAAQAPSTAISSGLLGVEVHRACRRTDLDALPLAVQLLAEFAVIPLDTSILGIARDLTDPVLRNLDALHLASAVSLGPAVQAFVTYDRRLAAAASSAGLDVVSPGT